MKYLFKNSVKIKKQQKNFLIKLKVTFFIQLQLLLLLPTQHYSNLLFVVASELLFNAKAYGIFVHYTKRPNHIVWEYKKI